ncbi:MAG: Na+/H+ antiporter NhaA [Alphaproteobacteria bacterium]|nr:Na+/H+ antiporter NhaA [Alphaproteobacteria bacterium]
MLVLVMIPHADRSFGVFAEAEAFLHDPLNRLAHHLVKPLAGVLLCFGLTRGGIDLSVFQPTTLVLLAALWIGKPLGILAGLSLASRPFNARLPQAIARRDHGRGCPAWPCAFASGRFGGAWALAALALRLRQQSLPSRRIVFVSRIKT